MEGLTEGRIVHYSLGVGEHRAAIVTDVIDKNAGVVSLVVFWLQYDSPMDTNYVSYNEHTDYYGSWHWIEKA